MTDNDLKLIFNLRDEILKVAPERVHAWEDEDRTDYGKATGTKWGHVRVQSDIQPDNSEHDNECGSIGGIKAYIKYAIDSRIQDTPIDPLTKSYIFTSYGDAEGTIKYGSGKVKVIGKELNNLTPVKVIENTESSFVNKIFYIKSDASADNQTLNQLHKIQSIPIYVTITKDNEIYNFTSYGDAEKTIKYGIGTVEIIDEGENGFIPIKVLTNEYDDSFVSKIFFIQDTAQADTDAIYQLYEMQAIDIYVKISKLIDIDDTLLFSKTKVSSELENIKKAIAAINFDNEKNELEALIEDNNTATTNKFESLHTFNEATQATTSIDNLKEPGYYYYEEQPVLNYGYDEIKCGIITVKQINNSTVQHIESCDANGDLDGNEYKRIYNTKWSELEVIKRNNIDSVTDTVNETDTQIIIKESTAGYTITWVQTSDNKIYEVTADLYQYEDLYIFKQPLMIDKDNAYIFSNLIGKMDVKITYDKIQVRSTLAKGNKIKNVDETYFIPRNR